VHPVAVAGAAEARGAGGFDDGPEGLVGGRGEARAVAAPAERVALGVEVDGDAPSVHREGRAAAHGPVVEAAPEEVQPQALELVGAVVRHRLAEDPRHGGRHQLVAAEARDARVEIPGEPERDRQLDDPGGAVGAAGDAIEGRDRLLPRIGALGIGHGMARQRHPVDGGPHRPGGPRGQRLAGVRPEEPVDPARRMAEPRQHRLAGRDPLPAPARGGTGRRAPGSPTCH